MSSGTSALAPTASPDEPDAEWRRVTAIVRRRDGGKCFDCGEACPRGVGDVHHRIPRSAGGGDEPANLILLCDGCHAARHPNLQVGLARRTMERWALRLAQWVDFDNHLPDRSIHFGDVLRQLGHDRFREGQLEAVLAALRGESILVVRPTGSGKSLCFQVPTLLTPGTAFAIVPLKALMSDQVLGLHKALIPATFINGDLSPQEKKVRYDLLESGSLKFVYVAPERFDSTRVRPHEVAQLTTHRPSFLIVDEAHCIDRWGSDFRPSYGQLGDVRLALGEPPVLAFTATAGPRTQRRVLQSLGIPNARALVSGVDRPNIALFRHRISDADARHQLVCSLVQEMEGKSMIFVPTVKVGNEVREGLLRWGLDVPFYHSKSGRANERDLILGRFTGRLEPPLPVVICTNAFGMGLDVPDVRLVVHWQHPASPEDYLQEFGRAGRDGKPAVAVLFSDHNDAGLLRFMAEKTVEASSADEDAARRVLEEKYELIAEMTRLAQPDAQCFRRELLAYFEGGHRPRRPLSVRILEWVFGHRSKKTRGVACCDYCDARAAELVRDGEIAPLLQP